MSINQTKKINTKKKKTNRVYHPSERQQLQQQISALERDKSEQIRIKQQANQIGNKLVQKEADYIIKRINKEIEVVSRQLNSLEAEELKQRTAEFKQKYPSKNKFPKKFKKKKKGGFFSFLGF